MFFTRCSNVWMFVCSNARQPNLPWSERQMINVLQRVFRSSNVWVFPAPESSLSQQPNLPRSGLQVINWCQDCQEDCCKWSAFFARCWGYKCWFWLYLIFQIRQEKDCQWLIFFTSYSIPDDNAEFHGNSEIVCKETFYFILLLLPTFTF